MLSGLFVEDEITVRKLSSSFTEKVLNCWTVNSRLEPPPPPQDTRNIETIKNCSELFFISNLLMYYSPDGKRR